MKHLKDLVVALSNLPQTEKLELWNEELEDLTKSSSSSSSSRSVIIDNEYSSEEKRVLVQSCANVLHEKLMETLSSGGNSSSQDNESENISEALLRWKEMSPESKDEIMLRLGPILRAAKNFLRWYLQWYVPSVHPKDLGSSSSSDPLSKFKAHSMLEFYLSVIEYQSRSNPILARHVALLLFYSTFHPISTSDPIVQASYEFLIHQCDFFPRLMQVILVADDFSPLCVAVARNIHNVSSSSPTAARLFFEQAALSDHDIVRPNWIPESIHPLTYIVILRSLVDFSISQDPTFPGNEDDLRSELVQEILRTFYALKVGQTVHMDPQLQDTLIRVIQLQGADSTCHGCRVAAVAILTDLNYEEAKNQRHWENLVNSLFDILDQCISDLFQSKLLDDAGAATLIPPLVVLYRFCQTSQSFLERTRAIVFPLDSEEHFQNLVQAEKLHSPKAKNMKPLDAPEGSLRFKIIQLLTWPQSHVKRFASELLWILCNSDSQEFVYRVGMGNALPLLSMKGLAKLPASTFS